MSNQQQQIPPAALSFLEGSDLYHGEGPVIVVDTEKQLLMLCEGQVIQSTYLVSTAAQGLGCDVDSFKTPTGIHRIAEKIGGDEPEGMIFEGRAPVGKLAEVECKPEPTGQDLITSRILWLEGVESGVNQGEGVDSHDRYIYIHGTNEEGLIGQAVSHGCIRLSNQDVIELFEKVDTGALVLIL